MRPNVSCGRGWGASSGRPPSASLPGRGSNAIVREEGFGFGETGRDAGRGDGFAFFDLGGDFQIQGEELSKQILLGAETAGGEDGGVQDGVGVFERVGAGDSAVLARSALTPACETDAGQARPRRMRWPIGPRYRSRAPFSIPRACPPKWTG